MKNYQVLARRYRPQRFSDVVGQDAIVITLKNAIKFERLAHAYLFCGSRGTGKTSLARIFAKALNCQNPGPDFEPCNECGSCREITSGHSLDVLEIDGASHRGIDDIRQINDNVGYAPASGKYKIYIIDEVHMLTKEAFNALLKTLEEPPPRVKFFFATTEPHKVLPTIISRCQRYNLNRIPFDNIVTALQKICLDLGIEAEEAALHMVANVADGGLRDAQSILDQLISFQEGKIQADTVAEVLAIMPKERLFDFDLAVKEGRLAAAFELAHDVFAQGKDLGHFLDTLTEHYRNFLLIKLSEESAPSLEISEGERTRYSALAGQYRQEQLLTILDLLMEAQTQLKFLPNQRIGLENTLLKIIRSYQRIPVEHLVRRLIELEKTIEQLPEQQAAAPMQITLKQQNLDLGMGTQAAPAPAPAPQVAMKAVSPTAPPKAQAVAPKSTPAPQPKKAAAPKQPQSAEERVELRKKQSRLDTLVQFAKVEFGGTIEKKGPVHF